MLKLNFNGKSEIQNKCRTNDENLNIKTNSKYQQEISSAIISKDFIMFPFITWNNKITLSLSSGIIKIIKNETF